MSIVDSPAWENLSAEEKQHELYEQQKALLATFLEHGAITQMQYDKSLHDLTEKMVSTDYTI